MMLSIYEITLVGLLITASTWTGQSFLLKSQSAVVESKNQSVSRSRILAGSRNVLNIRSGLPRGVFKSGPKPLEFSVNKAKPSSAAPTEKVHFNSTTLVKDVTTQSTAVEIATFPNTISSKEVGLPSTTTSNAKITEGEGTTLLSMFNIFATSFNTTSSAAFASSTSASTLPASRKIVTSATSTDGDRHTETSQSSITQNIFSSTFSLTQSSTFVTNKTIHLIQTTVPNLISVSSTAAAQIKTFPVTNRPKIHVIHEPKISDSVAEFDTTSTTNARNASSEISATSSLSTDKPASTMLTTLATLIITTAATATTPESTNADARTTSTAAETTTTSATEETTTTPTTEQTTTTTTTTEPTTTAPTTTEPTTTTTTTTEKTTTTTTTEQTTPVVSTSTTSPVPCDRSVHNLHCVEPDFDEKEIFGRCTWAAGPDETVAYVVSITDLSSNDVAARFNSTTFNSYAFLVGPGKRYDITVQWLLEKSLDADVDLSTCKPPSSYILNVPHEKPKIDSDVTWLLVNLTVQTIFIKNPFYQFVASSVARLSIDLTIPNKNSSVICEPASWYDVGLSETRSCKIKNLSNDTINQLDVILNASGDASGKDARSFNFVKESFIWAPEPVTGNGLPLPATTTTSTPTAEVAVSEGNELAPPSSQPVVDNAAAAGGGAAAGVVVGAIIVFLLIFLVRRYRNSSPKQTWQANVSMPPGLALAEDNFSSTANMATSAFVVGPLQPEQFSAYMASLERNSGLGYASLWEDIRLVGLQQPCVYAELPVNRHKNRFTNVLPYDGSRVKLLPWPTLTPRKENGGESGATDEGIQEGNDYVNANFVPGLFSDHEYIATQGPLPHTIADFWRAIWQHRVCAIVMLTKLKEGGIRKCECYWPPGVDSEAGDSPFGPLTVQLVSQSDEVNSSPTPNSDRFGFDQPSENPNVWTIRDFRITLPAEDGSNHTQIRTLRQYHFMDWPDQGVPSGSNRDHLLRFVRLVRSQVDRDSGNVVEPILVHCSAGVGRTGAFIAMDILLQDLAAGRPLDVNGVVVKLRDYRQLVQTEQQYRFIHELLLDAINSGSGEGNTFSSDPTVTTQTNTTFAPPKRRKGKANTAFIEDDENAHSELDDRV